MTTTLSTLAPTLPPCYDRHDGDATINRYGPTILQLIRSNCGQSGDAKRLWSRATRLARIRYFAHDCPGKGRLVCPVVACLTDWWGQIRRERHCWCHTCWGCTHHFPITFSCRQSDRQSRHENLPRIWQWSEVVSVLVLGPQASVVPKKDKGWPTGILLLDTDTIMKGAMTQRPRKK